MTRESALPALWKITHPDGIQLKISELPGRRALAQRAMLTRQLLRLTLADGSERWLSVNASPLTQPGQDDPYAVVTSLTDVTDQVLAQERTRQSQLELERKVAERTQHLQDALAKLQLLQVELVEAQKLASLGSLVAGISHELNTPIGVAVTTASSLSELMARTSLVLSGGAVSRSAMQGSLTMAQEMADLVLKSTEKASTLIASFKRVAVDDTSEKRRPFDLTALLDDLLLALHHSLKGCEWIVEPAIEPGLVLDSFPGPMDQVLTNLIQNAQFHAFGGHGPGTLHIQARRVNATAEIVVRDDGVGMSPDVLRRVFEPFFTTRLGQGGSGLGLSIVRTLVTQKLGGTIRVESEPGLGTTFTLHIPLVAPQLDAANDVAGPSLNRPEPT
jgi:signal transduction histidine kinase